MLTLLLLEYSFTIQDMLETAYEIYRSQKQYFDALRVILRLGRTDAITDLLVECEDSLMRRQMCLLLGRHRVNYEVEHDALEEDAELLNELIGNAKNCSDSLALPINSLRRGASQ